VCVHGMQAAVLDQALDPAPEGAAAKALAVVPRDARAYAGERAARQCHANSPARFKEQTRRNAVCGSTARILWQVPTCTLPTTFFPLLPTLGCCAW
jgi:hypothetical protein